ncbi:hypothetical protein LXL04_024109 [Taraxacum kok-saghyz]
MEKSKAKITKFDSKQDDGERVKESAKDDPSGRSTRGSDGRSTMPAGGRQRTGVGSRQRSASVCVGSSYPAAMAAAMERVRLISERVRSSRKAGVDFRLQRWRGSDRSPSYLSLCLTMGLKVRGDQALDPVFEELGNGGRI